MYVAQMCFCFDFVLFDLFSRKIYDVLLQSLADACCTSGFEGLW